MAKGPVGKYLCVKCNKEISLIAKTRHDRSCNGVYRVYKETSVISNICSFCSREFSTIAGCANHSIQCPFNPNRIFRKTNYSWNKGNRSKPDTRNPEYIGKSGGYRANAGRSKKFKVYDSFGKSIILQSTYEYAVFEILAELEIRWVRPKAIKYGTRNYFADFYLIDFDVYLDPKNDYKAKQDSQKIKDVTEQNNVRLYVLLQDQINKQTIASLI